MEADFHNIPLLFNNSPIEFPLPTAFLQNLTNCEAVVNASFSQIG